MRNNLMFTLNLLPYSTIKRKVPTLALKHERESTSSNYMVRLKNKKAVFFPSR